MPGFPVGTGTFRSMKPEYEERTTNRESAPLYSEIRREILHSDPFDYAQGEQDDKREAGLPGWETGTEKTRKRAPTKRNTKRDPSLRSG